MRHIEREIFPEDPKNMTILGIEDYNYEQSFRDQPEGTFIKWYLLLDVLNPDTEDLKPMHDVFGKVYFASSGNGSGKGKKLPHLLQMKKSNTGGPNQGGTTRERWCVMGCYRHGT